MSSKTSACNGNVGDAIDPANGDGDATGKMDLKWHFSQFFTDFHRFV
jgi:hypothetical protein